MRSLIMIMVVLAAGVTALVDAQAPSGSTGRAQVAPATACVTIGTPKPTLGYTYEHIESTGNRSQYTQYWESFTETESRLRIVRPGQQTLIQTTVYRVEDDVARISRMTKASGSRVLDSTTFEPALVSDPIFRACTGRNWPVPSVAVVYEGATSARARSPQGTLRITAINEKVTVPAGTFDTVRYLRTSQSTDEYWKSIEHGVIVKHVATVAGNSVLEQLVAIK